MRTLFTGLTPPDTDCIHTPLIEIAPVDDDTALRSVLSCLADYDYLLFTSRFAVSVVVQYTAVLPQFTKVVSIGPTTTAALQAAGLTGIAQAERDNSYGVIDWFSRQSRGKVLIPRSNIALNIIPDGLWRLGFEVDTVTAYQNRMPQHPQKVDLREIDRIVFTSPSTIDNFIRLYGSLPEGKEFVTRGPITEQHLLTIIKQQNL
ncbi:MAG: uroporphyrinogen-III synthase [Prevotella sp.]|nr:uroporphyrinogen-III synthase [Prevotella sp.]